MTSIDSKPVYIALKQLQQLTTISNTFPVGHCDTNWLTCVIDSDGCYTREMLLAVLN